MPKSFPVDFSNLRRAILEEPNDDALRLSLAD
jgi:uncharacterized protein (TIGR02996 family)